MSSRRRKYIPLPYTRRQARRLGVRVYPSTRQNKKLDVFCASGDRRYLVSVGAIGYRDYPTYWKERGKAYANTRRRAYKSRHESNRHRKGSAGYYADQLLW